MVGRTCKPKEGPSSSYAGSQWLVANHAAFADNPLAGKASGDFALSVGSLPEAGAGRGWAVPQRRTE